MLKERHRALVQYSGPRRPLQNLPEGCQRLLVLAIVEEQPPHLDFQFWIRRIGCYGIRQVTPKTFSLFRRVQTQIIEDLCRGLQRRRIRLSGFQCLEYSCRLLILSQLSQCAMELGEHSPMVWSHLLCAAEKFDGLRWLFQFQIDLP